MINPPVCLSVCVSLSYREALYIWAVLFFFFYIYIYSKDYVSYVLLILLSYLCYPWPNSHSAPIHYFFSLLIVIIIPCFHSCYLSSFLPPTSSPICINLLVFSSPSLLPSLLPIRLSPPPLPLPLRLSSHSSCFSLCVMFLLPKISLFFRFPLQKTESFRLSQFSHWCILVFFPFISITLSYSPHSVRFLLTFLLSSPTWIKRGDRPTDRVHPHAK